MKLTAGSLLLLSIGSGAWAQTQYTSTATSAAAKAAATALTLSPTSKVVGKTFDRFVQIWLENTDYSLAAGDSKLLLHQEVKVPFRDSMH